VYSVIHKIRVKNFQFLGRCDLKKFGNRYIKDDFTEGKDIYVPEIVQNESIRKNIIVSPTFEFKTNNKWSTVA